MSRITLETPFYARKQWKFEKSCSYIVQKLKATVTLNI